MLHQFIQTYNILTVIFHFSHLSICFPTSYQQSNGARWKKCLTGTPATNCLSESLLGFAQIKAISRRPQLTNPLDGLHYEGEQAGFPGSLHKSGHLKLFVLQFWLCRCNFTQWEMFLLQPKESWFPSPCNLRAGLFLPSSPECLSIM